MSDRSIINTPLKIYQPYNLVVYLSFYSPIILTICLIGMSFVFQNFKGFIYLGFLLGCCVIREFIYKYSGSNPSRDDPVKGNPICSSIEYSIYGNPTFSAFVFAFTIMYISLPMFINGAVNFWIFSVLIIYFFLDMFIKNTNNCIIKISDLIINILLGLSSAALILSFMYAGGSSKYLFFNEVSSNKEMCSQPNKQTFKCSVYKNGELIGNV